MGVFQCRVQTINGLLRMGLQAGRNGGRWQQKGRREAGLCDAGSDRHQYLAITGPPQR
jgi:hypothetical protein